ncbi:conjugal transfer protein TraB [Halolactibacillus alkaliphilus]|uniref:Conjugal transfer protein TraB n=1 Tax=Halolactibacillus alkaliphilus TaxID=442899 RepID=A0A511WXR2_9BACI|nr:conjugal transfer protein TraB [Halolactibacillus alkaliphilus]GGN65699.1 conjugal transfer protein TraB [Halolactibacillus alkaliphilus]SFO66056.1 pheromone shutdown-related protein TraB [Halolactibacillus alkaliphilus]
MTENQRIDREEIMQEETTNTVIRIEQDDKLYILIGTAHVSKTSAEEVKRVIEAERPDAVCIELDEQRYQAIMDADKWKKMDIFKVIKDKKATLLLMNLAISSFQKRMAKQFNIEAGQEMIQGIKSAEEVGAELVLADRNIQITFSRIWGNVGTKGKLMLLTQVLAGIFSNETITEEELEKMKSQDAISSILDEFTEHFPRLKTPLIDERDQYLAEKIKRAKGKKIVAVLGAAHVPGITEEIKKDHDLNQLNKVPKKSKWPKRIAWFIPIAIVGMILTTFIMNPEAGTAQIWSWLLWNGLFSAVGTAIAFGHPLAILTALLAAPITSLNPLMAAGWFSGLVQAYVKKPQVSDFEALSDDVYTVKGFWQNKVTRVLLVVMLANLGSTMGTIIAGTDVVRLFIENIF